MTVRREANDSASATVKIVKAQIEKCTGIKAGNLSLDQMVRLADKAGYSVIVSCGVKP